MRYRRLDENQDYVFGRGKGGFFVDAPQAVAQAVMTRLSLWEGEWFLNTQDGTPYLSAILGRQNIQTYDDAIRGRINGTIGVLALVFYNSNLDEQRGLLVDATIDTVYGETRL